MYHLGELYHKLLPIRSQLNPDIYWNLIIIEKIVNYDEVFLCIRFRFNFILIPN